MILSKLAAILLASVPLAQAAIQCSATQKCPEEAPCCSQYGECGTGTVCLGGCHPGRSFSKDSCMAMPVCKNIETKFQNVDDVLVSLDYSGNPDEKDWIYGGYVYNYEGFENKAADDTGILLTMPKDTSGTVLSSSRYVWYGKATATLKTSRGHGVVGAFILFSNVGDEIDWEFMGYDLNNAEMNYYYEGVENWTHMTKAPVTGGDTFEEYHTYEIDWTEEQITWSLDGKSIRVLKKADTYDATTGVYQFPQTPSRVQFSLWPGGLASNAPGTIEWAGGEIDWNHQDIQEHGYYYVVLKDAKIECYDPPSETQQDGSSAYVFTDDNKFAQDTVAITDDDTSLDGSAKKSKSSSASASASLSSSSIMSSSSSDAVVSSSLLSNITTENVYSSSAVVSNSTSQFITSSIEKSEGTTIAVATSSLSQIKTIATVSSNGGNFLTGFSISSIIMFICLSLV